MGFQGDLDTFGLATIFQTLTANQLSGTLHVFDEHSERYLVFSQGSIRTVSTGKRQNVSLGEILVARGSITQEQLSQCLAEQTVNSSPLGQALVNKGYCSQQDLEGALRFQMEEEIYDLFTWKGAKFTFDEQRKGDTLVGSDLRICQVKVNSSGVILEAMRRIDEWNRLNALLPSLDIVPGVPRPLPPEFVAALSHEERRILEFVNGANSLETISRKCCLGRYAVTQLLAKMFEQGLAAEAPPEELRTRAMACIGQGDFESAAPLLCRVLSLSPNDAEARRALASALEATGKDREAGREYQAAAAALCAAGDYAGAAAAGARAHELLPRDREILKNLADLSLLAERRKDAAEAYLRLAKLYEEDKNLPQALAVLAGAAEELPDHEDIQRLRARLFLSEGEQKKAIECYEQLAARLRDKGDKAGAINLLRAIARLDTSRTDIPERIRQLQLSGNQLRQRRITRYVALGLGTALAVAVLAFTISQISGNLAAGKALETAEKLRAEAGHAAETKRLELLTRALAELREADSALPLFGGNAAKVTALEAELSAQIETLRSETEKREAEQLRAVEDWLRLREQDTPEAAEVCRRFEALAAGDSGSKQEERARTLLAEWKVEQEKKRGGLAVLLGKIGNRSLATTARYAAYRELAEKYPETLARRMPNGPLGLTLPAEVDAVSETGARLRAEVLVQGADRTAFTPCTIELPLDTATPVFLRRKGFGDPRGLTPLKRDGGARERYSVILKRGHRWRVELSGILETPPAYSEDGRTVFAATADGEVYAVGVATGAVLWQKAVGKELFGGEAFRAAPLPAGGRLILLGQSGALCALSQSGGKVLWPGAGTESPLRGEICEGLFAVSLGDLGRAGGGERSDALVSSRSSSPLFAFDCSGGELLWPRSETGKNALKKRVGRVMGSPCHLAGERQLLALDESGSLHVLLEDGTYVGAAKAAGGRVDGAPLFLPGADGKSVRLLFMEEGAGLKLLEIPRTSPLTPKTAWVCDRFRNESLTGALRQRGDRVFAGFGSGTVAGVALADGDCAAAWTLSGLPGAVRGGLVVDGGTLIVCCGETGGGACLTGVRVSGKGFAGEAWRYPLGKVSGAAGAVLRDGCVVCGGEGFLAGLDTEEE